MKLYTTYCIITADTNKKINYVLSTDSKDIALPICEISNPRTLYNEMRYNTKKMFNANVISFIQEILISYTEIQPEPLTKYIETINKEQTYDLDNSLFLLCGILMEKKESQSFWWKKYEFSKQTIDNPLFSIIDHTIQKSMI